ncbi:MAG: efflux RND transporter periplasmic adaptor subunit [Peptococcaceae bacterium]|nr:efflux RND transporter periplasmic adaptor subunit [Peptococcaceae bacterium]
MRVRLLFVAIFVIVLLSSAGCGSKSGNTGKGGPGTGVNAVAVAASPLELADIKDIRYFNGQVQPASSAVLAPKVAGRVAAVAVRMGDRVKKGDVLFTLDTSEISAQVRTQEADLAMSRAKLEMARKNREYYRNALENYKKLYEAGAISKDKYDEMALKYDQAMSGEYEAAVAKSEASLNYQQSLLAGSTVRSPVDGVVSFVSVEAGQNVTTATQAVGVVDISTVKVKIFVGDQHINLLSTGQQVDVEVPDVKKDPFTGKIIALSPVVDSIAKGYPVEIELANPDGLIKQGMFARVRIPVAEKKSVPVVPVDAIVNRPDGKYLFVVENGKAKECKVETGVSEGNKTEVSGEGLKPGDMVVTMGQQSLADGMPVRLSQAGKPGAQGSVAEGGQPPGNAPGKPSAGEGGKGAPAGEGATGGSGR